MEVVIRSQIELIRKLGPGYGIIRRFSAVPFVLLSCALEIRKLVQEYMAARASLPRDRSGDWRRWGRLAIC